MFTGIVEEVGKVVSTQASAGRFSLKAGRLVIAARETLKNVKPGGSVAINGVCLTVTDFTATSFAFDVMPETLKRTNLGLLKSGDKVNLERPLGLGGEVGGHLVQGHIDDTGKVISIAPEGESILMRFEAPPGVMRYVVPKGFIAVDGISLTVTGTHNNSFQVSLVDFTLKHTNLGSRKAGDRVNLEVDIIAKYVEQFL
ncbi:MAG: riboflavin synthase, partial [Chloroflexota bacterium]